VIASSDKLTKIGDP